MDLSRISENHILDYLEDAIYVLAPNGDTLYVNNADAAVFGLSKEEVMSFNVINLARKGKTNPCVLELVLASKQPVTVIQEFYSADYPNGRKMMTTQIPIFNATGDIEYTIGVIRDIEKLRTMYEKAELIKNAAVAPATGLSRVKYIGDDPKTKLLLENAKQIANFDASVMITGESGAGKEMLAQYIHDSSIRSKKKMVCVNCAAIPESLLEAELFGYVKGAFTGAVAAGKKGLIEEANGSTLFLDEINSLPMELQGKLLRVIETRQVRPLGSNKDIDVDFRLITATSEDLSELVSKKKFRLDLYFRCNVLPFVIPPLRDRVGDIKPLCDYFLLQCKEKYGQDKVFAEEAYESLMNYSWPGNVRELKNLIERIVLTTEHGVKTIHKIPRTYFSYLSGNTVTRENAMLFEDSFAFVPGMSLKEHLAKYEKWLIDQAVKEYGSLNNAAKELGVDKSTLIRKKKR